MGSKYKSRHKGKHKFNIIVPIIALLLLSLFYLLPNLVFFWGYYIERVILLIISIAFIVVSYFGVIKFLLSIKEDRNDKHFLRYSKKDRKERKVFIIIATFLFLLSNLFFGFLISVTYKDVISLTKDIPYVLNKNYSKVEGFVKSAKYSSIRGETFTQDIKIYCKEDRNINKITFRHKYSKIESSTEYTIWYLPNSRLGVSAEKVFSK